MGIAALAKAIIHVAPEVIKPVTKLRPQNIVTLEKSAIKLFTATSEKGIQSTTKSLVKNSNVTHAIDLFTATIKSHFTKLFKVPHEGELNKLFKNIVDSDIKNLDGLIEHLKLEGINAHSVRRYFDSKTLGGYEIDELINAGLLNNKTELLSTFIKDLKAHPFIKKHTVFSPYNLDFAETAEIAEVLKEGKFFDLGKITKILKTKNPELYEKLGGEMAFMQNSQGKTIAYNSISELQDKLYGIKSISKYITDPQKIKTLDFAINDEVKTFLYSDALNVGDLIIPKIGQREIKTLIESNMLTTDFLKTPEFRNFLKDKAFRERLSAIKVSYKNPLGIKIDDTVDAIKLLEKLDKEGIQALNCNEVHALTDVITDFYNKLPSDIQKDMIKRFSDKGTHIYTIVQGMKNDIKAVTQAKILPNGNLEFNGIEFKDHFFMRMIDRDLANVVDNTTGEILSTKDLLIKIAEKLKTLKIQNGNCDIFITDVQGHGLKFIAKFENGKPCIDTIMQ